jgi:ribonucleoside-diphosphate reductase alpha chain
MDMSINAPQPLSVEVLLEKYAKGAEQSAADVRWRVAHALAANEAATEQADWADRFFRAQNERGVVMAGRINSSAGTGLKATLINCFVQSCGDSVSGEEDGLPSIYTALAESAETMRRGGGVGFNFSAIRPRGARVKGTQSRASGPVSYMRVFDQSCTTVESAGARRGAQMGILNVDHPDVEEFIAAKRTPGQLTNFNLSVRISNKFMECVQAQGQWDLVHGKEPDLACFPNAKYDSQRKVWVYRSIKAADLWETIMRSTYEYAEPGVVFEDTTTEDNNLSYCESIEATNPCAEQPLPAYGSCCLGQIDLTKHVVNPFTPDAAFDFEGFEIAVNDLVRMLDNTLSVTQWPLAKQAAESESKRRVGAGYIGLGNTLTMLGLRYDRPEGREMAVKISTSLRDQAYMASVDLARERGSFPLFDASKYLASGFTKRLPEHIREAIRTYGIRNSHLISIAPTGTISLAFCDNASGGIEPAFSYAPYTRKKRMADGSTQEYQVEDRAFRLYKQLGGDTSKLPEAFVGALEMQAVDHLKMVAAVAPLVDSAISKTINVPVDYPYADFQDIYLMAWKWGIKGITTYRPNSILGSVLSVTPAAPAAEPAKQPEQAAPVVALPHDEDPLRKQFSSRPIDDLEGVTKKIELHTYEGKKSLYVTVNFMQVTGVINGQKVVIERPIEFFVPAGQKDSGQQWISVAMRLLSFTARSGGSVAKALQAMRQTVWDHGQVRYGLLTKEDGSSRPMFHDSEVAAIGYALQQILLRRGFLDAVGNQVPVALLATRQPATDTNGCAAAACTCSAPQAQQDAAAGLNAANGKKCPECGANGVHRVDGCSRCISCGHLGGCG